MQPQQTASAAAVRWSLMVGQPPLSLNDPPQEKTNRAEDPQTPIPLPLPGARHRRFPTPVRETMVSWRRGDCLITLQWRLSHHSPSIERTIFRLVTIFSGPFSTSTYVEFSSRFPRGRQTVTAKLKHYVIRGTTQGQRETIREGAGLRSSVRTPAPVRSGCERLFGNSMVAE